MISYTFEGLTFPDSFWLESLVFLALILSGAPRRCVLRSLRRGWGSSKPDGARSFRDVGQLMGHRRVITGTGEATEQGSRSSWSIVIALNSPLSHWSTVSDFHCATAIWPSDIQASTGLGVRQIRRTSTSRDLPCPIFHDKHLPAREA